MKSAVERLDPTRVKITIEVPFDELEPNVKAAYQRIAKQINVPGFRKGKVPPPVIDRQVGRGVILDEAINEAIPQLYVAALQENDLVPLAQPEIDVTSFVDGEVLEFTAEVDVRPEITVPSYEGIEVQVDDIEVADDDVEQQVQMLRERFATLTPVERAVGDGDVVTIDLVATRDGEAIDGGEVRGYSYKVGSGQLIEGVDEALTGLSVGEEKSFVSTLLGGAHEGEEVDVLVSVGAVNEQELPEFDDEFAQTASEFDTADELRADLLDNLTRQGRLAQAAAARDAVLEKLLEAAEIPVPEGVVSAEVEQRRQEMEQQLAFAGMTLQQYLDDEKQTIDEFEADLEKRVRDMLAAQFLLDEIAKAEEIGVEQEELNEHLFRRAQQSGQGIEAFMQHMVEHNHIPEMVGEVVRNKALARVVDAAKVTDASGNHVELTNLRPDGTIAEPEPEPEPEPESAPEDADEAGEAASDED